jgi:type IV pilus assembly protein PilB
VTGPTGSGKSTTLYAALDQLIKRDLSVVRVEETVEFHILGIDQVQVNEHTGLTFPRALRNIRYRVR